MRAGPLSQPRVISMLNKYFVPVYVSNEDYRDPAITPDDERAQYEEVFEDAKDKGLSTGTVHVYILSPEGEVVDSRHVQDAERTPVLLKLLRRNADRFRLTAGRTLIQPSPQSEAPPGDDDDLVLRLVTRAARGQNPWSGMTDDWIRIRKRDWTQLRSPSTDAGHAWALPVEMAESLFTHVYPPSPNYDVATHSFRICQFSARFWKIEDGQHWVALEGRVSMEHDFFHGKKDRIDAVLTGYARYDPNDEQTPPVLRMSSFSARYGDGRFDVLLYSD